MDTHDIPCCDRPFAGLRLLLQIFFGPLLWSTIIGNALGLAWCISQGRQSFLAFWGLR